MQTIEYLVKRLFPSGPPSQEEVSDEFTAYPYFLIIEIVTIPAKDPTTEDDIEHKKILAGVWFSRAAAEEHLIRGQQHRSQLYPANAVVWCYSGSRSNEYRAVCDAIDEEVSSQRQTTAASG